MFLLLIEIGNHSNLCKIQLKYCNTTFQEQQSLQHVMINQMNKCKIIATLFLSTLSLAFRLGDRRLRISMQRSR